jgi:hypothetical protein
MVHYDHGMVGATVALAAGVQRRYGWPVVLLAAIAGMFPDWDSLAKHISRETYLVGHRTWGHNLFAVTLAGVVLGVMGYGIHRSVAQRRPAGVLSVPSKPAQWILLSVLIVWTHPLLDLLYCGPAGVAAWPVALFWPVFPDGFAQPWVPWSDRGATFILVTGLLVVVLVPRQSQRYACVSLVLLIVYVTVRGALLRV